MWSVVNRQEGGKQREDDGGKRREAREIWQEAIDVVKIVYELTNNSPREEMYGLDQSNQAVQQYPYPQTEPKAWAGADRER